jgi:hypothetical protein
VQSRPIVMLFVAGPAGQAVSGVIARTTGVTVNVYVAGPVSVETAVALQPIALISVPLCSTVMAPPYVVEPPAQAPAVHDGVAPCTVV